MNAKQATFVTEYLVDLNATQAAIRAGYSKRTAYSQGQRLLKKVEIEAAIAESRRKAADKAEVTREWIIEQLRANVVDCRTPGETYNPSAANKALELLGKERGMFVDRRLLGLRHLDDMSEEELLEFLGGEPDPEELSQAAGTPAVGHA